MRKGLAFGVAGYVFWGLATFYWRLLADLTAPEILVHRVLWALPLLLLFLWFRHRLSELRAIARADRLRLMAAGFAVLANWGLFVWAVLLERVVDASLAYYINPFLSVAFGVALFGERLSPRQWWSLGIAGAGVLAMIAIEGRVPWLALAIALTFAAYGALKKQSPSAQPVVALTVETATVWPLAVVGLVVFGASGTSAFGSHPLMTWLLVGAGLITVVPLIFFGEAVKRIPLAWVGVLQFITPTMFFLEGVFLFDEDVSPARWLGFTLVWVAVGLFVSAQRRSISRS